ncbi:MAG: gamma-glutamyltransferase [Nitrososphaerales archaeon]
MYFPLCKEFRARKGMVITKHPLASHIGLEILKRGGNAVDAAIASAFAIGVVEPHMSGLGGGTWIVIHLSNKEDFLIDASPKVPSKIQPFELKEGYGSMYGWKKVKEDENLIGYRSILTPASLAGLSLAIEKFCKFSLEELIEPSIKLAEEGFSITPSFTLALVQEYENIIRYEETAKIFLRNGKYALKPCFQEPLSPADVLVQRDLASTLKLIAKRGKEEFFKGEIANRIAEDLERNEGFVKYSDLANYEARFMKPQKGTYRNSQIFTTIAHGGATLIQILNLLEGFNLRKYKHNTFEYLYLLAKAMGLAFRDRYNRLADPDTEKVDLAFLLSKAYAEELRKNLQEDFKLKSNLNLSCTTHICACDKEENMVSLTQTLGMLFGSKVVIKGTGLLMNDGFMWFDPTGKSIARILPNKYPLGAATPSIVNFHGNYLCIGAPGGRRIIGAVLQGILNVLEYDMGPQRALERPRIDYSTDEVLVDYRLENKVKKLIKYGLKVRIVREDMSSFNFASPIAILRDKEGIMYSGIDPYKPDNSVACF